MKTSSKTARHFVVVSSYFPPTVGGTSTVLRNLLGAFKSDSYRVVAEAFPRSKNSCSANAPRDVLVDRIGVSSLLTHRLPAFWRGARYYRFALIPFIARRICRALQETNADRIIAVYPSWMFLCAAQLAHRKTGIPLIPYYMDVSHVQEPWIWIDKLIASHWEPLILRGATSRLVLSGAIQEDLRARYNVESTVIPHSIEAKIAPREVSEANGKYSDECLLVHTGVVEILQRESLLRITTVIRRNPSLKARLVLSTPNEPEALKRQGFTTPTVEICSLDDAAVRSLQHRASILVAVLPFGETLVPFQRTAFPTKILEYMLSGKPILVHAPPGSYLAQHVKKYGYAALVEEPTETALAAAIFRLRDDLELRVRLASKAREIAVEQFDTGIVARKFVEACRLDPALLK